MKMSIFMDPFNFFDLESFLFYVWKLKEALRNKARAFLSLNTFLKSLLMNTGGTNTKQGFGLQAEPCNDDWSTNWNPESHHAKSLLNVFFYKLVLGFGVDISVSGLNAASVFFSNQTFSVAAMRTYVAELSKI